MKYSPYQMKRRAELIKKAQRLYKQGFSTREVGKMIGKSHGWVAYVLKEDAPVDK